MIMIRNTNDNNINNNSISNERRGLINKNIIWIMEKRLIITIYSSNIIVIVLF